MTIGSAVQTIGNAAFNGSSKISKITSLAMTAATLENSAFDVIGTSGVLYFPQNASGYDTWMAKLKGWTYQEITGE